MMKNMKRTRFVRTILCALLALSCGLAQPAFCSQYESADYDDYYGEMMLFFTNGFYADALEQYRMITEIWQDSLDRTGYCDDYALYAKGMMAVSEKRYSDAANAFAALADGFPADIDGVPKAEMLTLYAQGFAHTLAGETDKALEAFYACRGTLNASGMYEALSKPPYQPMSNLRTDALSAVSVVVSWSDASAGSAYYVVCAPEGAASGAVTVMSNEMSASFTDLIPDTKYSVSVIPDTEDAALPLSGGFTTPRSQEKAPYSLALRSARLYQYDAQIADSMGLSVITKLINNGSESARYALIEDGETVMLPYAEFEHANKSYLLFYSFSHDSANADRSVNVKIALRPASGGAYVMSEELPLLRGGSTGNYFRLGALLDMAYKNEKRWAEGHAGLEIYVNGALVDKRYIKLTV